MKRINSDVAFDDVALWPHIGEHLYDDMMYDLMSTDQVRNDAYLEAVKKLAPGRTVVDIGCGRDCNWARACIEAGSPKVYAIEVREDAFQAATQLIRSLGLQEKIILLNGLSTSVDLPERVDLCISEIIGNLGSSEGAVPILMDVKQRFLKQDGLMIPSQCVTRIAAMALPSNIHTAPHFGAQQFGYVEAIFKKVGHPFDLRLSIWRLFDKGLHSSVGVFEDLDFSNLQSSSERRETLTITQSGKIDGFATWINLWCHPEGQCIDTGRDLTNWASCIFPAFYPGLDVSIGDEIDIVCRTQYESENIFPSYHISGVVRRAKGSPVEFDYCSPHKTTVFKGSAFYESLF